MAERLMTRENMPLSSPLPVFGKAPLGTGGDELHELRVRIPVDLHRQLLSLKVLRGKSLAETVSLALDVYFAEHAKARREPTNAQDADEHA